MKVYRGHGGICLLNLGNRWRWVDLASYPVTLCVWMFTEIQEVVFSLEMVVWENCISWHSLLSRSSVTLHLVRRPAQHHLFIEHALHRLFVLCVLTATVSVSSSLCPLASKMAHTVDTFWCVFRKCLVRNLVGISASLTEFLVLFLSFSNHLLISYLTLRVLMSYIYIWSTYSWCF
jgi:hypothetical protein